MSLDAEQYTRTRPETQQSHETCTVDIFEPHHVLAVYTVAGGLPLPRGPAPTPLNQMHLHYQTLQLKHRREPITNGNQLCTATTILHLRHSIAVHHAPSHAHACIKYQARGATT